MDLHLRPRMLLLTPQPPEAVRAELEARLTAKEGILEGRVTRTQLAAWIASEERRLWSPCLEVNCRDHPRGTLIVGRLGPHMFLYSAMMFSFIGTGLIAAISSCWAFVQWRFGQAPVALFGLLPIVAAALFFAILDRLGRRRAHTQMVELARLVEGLGELQADEEGVLREAEALRFRGELQRQGHSSS